MVPLTTNSARSATESGVLRFSISGPCCLKRTIAPGAKPLSMSAEEGSWPLLAKARYRLRERAGPGRYAPLSWEILYTRGTGEADSPPLQPACGLLRLWRPGLRQVLSCPKYAAPIAIWRTREVKNAIKTTILLAAINGVILVIGDLLGGKIGLLVALGIAAVVNFVGYWHSDKIVLRAYRARAATEADLPSRPPATERLPSWPIRPARPGPLPCARAEPPASWPR